jgi:L-alanine-DL-glutamate epimerase-like enolase superfamily enzyme
MPRAIKITRISVTHFEWHIPDLGKEEKLGFDAVYQPGSRFPAGGAILTVETDAGVKGEVPGGIDARSAQYLLGRNPLERDVIWHDLKRAERGRLNSPPGAVDNALWDIAGKLYGAPIHELLGGWRMKLPCYASTYHGDENGGLSTAQDFADFALQCKQEFGYPAFKIHGWINGPIQREVDAVLAIRDAVGPGMALMLDPAGAFGTFDDVLRVLDTTALEPDAREFKFFAPGFGLIAAFEGLDSNLENPELRFELIDVARVPEPAALGLLGLGIAAIGYGRRRRGP